MCAAKREDHVKRDHPTIAQEIIDCISQGRAPTVPELGRAADRIERDLSGARSAFAWGGNINAPTRVTSMRIALAALVGTGQPDSAAGPASADAELAPVSIETS
jgi:hypothetical protein